MAEEVYALDWDMTEAADNGGGFLLLDPGKYPFVVADFTQSRSKGSDKMASCPMAILKLCVTAGDRDTTITDNICLSSKTEWRIAQFFKALGFPVNSETGRVQINWQQIVGRGGWVEVKVREYTNKNGETRETNDVQAYIMPEDVPAAEVEYNERYAAVTAPVAAPGGYASIPAAPTYQPAPVTAAPAPQYQTAAPAPQYQQTAMPTPQAAPQYQHPSMMQ